MDLRQEQTIEFWKEVVSEPLSVNDPIFLDYLRGIDANRIWNTATDEHLKSFLGTINRLSNETKSRPVGLTLLNQFVEQIDERRFLVIQESLASALHIAVKYIDQEWVQKLFVNMLSRCNEALELHQTISSSIIPKILSYLSALRPNETRRSLTVQEIKLLRVCIMHFHGPCGNHRVAFEKMCLPYIDSDNGPEQDLAFKILPLLSATGSGGNKRSKHGQDWYAMNVKILYAMHETIIQLYSDAAPSLEEYNPYETEFGILELPVINEKIVFLRYSLLKTRLKGLATLLGHYLSGEFPVPKPVPFKSILNIACKMVLLNPVDLVSKRSPKELIYLSGILPEIHEAALNIVKNLICCTGPNLLPESERIEQFSIQEFKWLAKSPNNFWNLRINLYQMLIKWLQVTNGFATNTKTVNTWFGQIRADVIIEKSSTTLNLKSSKSKAGNKRKGHSSGQDLSKCLTSGEKTVRTKNSSLCTAALRFLEALVPVLDSVIHMNAYQLLAQTIMDFSQEPITPSPYDEESCRIEIFKCVQTLILNPNSKSPMSLGILTSLINHGLTDSSPLVQEVCRNILSSLEKIVHPAVPTFGFSPVFNQESSPVVQEQDNENEVDMEDSHRVDTRENSCQTVESELPTSVRQLQQEEHIAMEHSNINMSPSTSLTQTIQSTIRKEIQELFAELPHFPHQLQLQRVPQFGVMQTSTTVNDIAHSDLDRTQSSNSQSKLTNGLGKRAADESDHLDNKSEGQQESLKKLRTAQESELSISGDCAEWLNDFVNLSPNRDAN